MAKGKNIGILTGGGDVPGLNSVIKAVVYRATEMGHSVTGIRRGWEGSRISNPRQSASIPRYVISLDERIPAPSTAPAARWLHTSRTNPRR